MVGGSSMIRFPLVISDSEPYMPGIETGLLGWHTSAKTNELEEEEEVRVHFLSF